MGCRLKILMVSTLVPRGSRRAAGLVRGSLGLAWRLQWPTILGWAMAGLVFGVLAGRRRDLAL